MSYQEKNITVSFMCTILILGFYLVNMFQMYQVEGLNQARIFSLWLTVIAATILVNIFASILTNILFSIIYTIKTRSDKSERFIADERDKSIELRGEKNSYITFSIGVFLSMLTFVFGQPPLVMFSLIIFFSIAAEIIGEFSKLYLYRSGL
jgi:hypothetical protein